MKPEQDTSHADVRASDAQSVVIRFLEDGAGRGIRAERIDTHGAMIFLIGDEALKIKRAVKYDFMDLSTVEKRQDLLDREFDLNRDAAPSIYRNVQPIVRKSDGTLELGGPGEILEWVLLMNRFPRDAELSRIAKAHGIDDTLAEQLGIAIARYHIAAPVRRLNAGTLIREILDELEGVFGTMHEILGTDAAAFLVSSREDLTNRVSDLEQRSRQGHVRRCHGDLHLRNIVLIDGVPTPFDALEFDERLGTCDTLYDLAFLLMDLDHLKMGHVANLVLNAYLVRAAPDLAETGLSLLPLYLSIRAAIRAMVNVQTSVVAGTGEDMKNDARTYLMQARSYLEPSHPCLVAIGGYSGTGKTTLARAVAHRIGVRPGAIHIRSDIVRKTLLHRDPFDRLGREGYTSRMTERTYDAMRLQAGRILAEGHSVILDAVHGDPDARRAAEAVADAAGCEFTGLWLNAPTQTRLARVASRGPDASDADADLVQKQARADPGSVDWHRIDTSLPQNEVVAAISALMLTSAAADRSKCGGINVGKYDANRSDPRI